MNRINVEERELRPASGFLMLFLLFALMIGFIMLPIVGATVVMKNPEIIPEKVDDLVVILVFICIPGCIISAVMMAGLKIVHPVEARIFTLFGKYYGTIKKPGFFYINPFAASIVVPADGKPRNSKGAAVQVITREYETTVTSSRSAISLKTQTLDNGVQKVNDVLGNPVIIGAVVVWRVGNPTTAVFSVENYREFLSVQTDSTIRNTTRLYPYDVFDEDDLEESVQEKTLRGSALEIAQTMKEELEKRVFEAGLIVEEVRITHLAYAEEIAAAMLQRQQAVAIIAARKKIVDGAVGMVKMAIDKLNEDDIVILDEDRKASMVSNLLVVLCGNRDAQPIVNSGSIY
ncbi:MAG: SPFH domain-containing protein [Coriobacteriia bacterium]|nr:SPFH domain-containing protein [Coriobacteriia bacterium]